MSDIFSTIKNVILTVALLLSMLLSPAAGTAYTAKDSQQAKLVFNAVSDVHIETNNADVYGAFKSVLAGMKANTDADAQVFLGDNVMNGQKWEHTLFFSAVGSMLNSKNTFVTMGNHDVGNGDGDVAQLQQRYLESNNRYLKNKLDKPYYHRVVNGCYMIFIVGRAIGDYTVIIDAEQFAWLQTVLDEAAESGNPVFVFSHYPFIYLEDENGNLVADLLVEYDNLFCLHGHTHWDYMTYESYGLHTVNLPRVTETVDYAPGDGVVVEVYEDSVVLRERNFITGEWLSEKTYEFLA